MAIFLMREAIHSLQKIKASWRVSFYVAFLLLGKLSSHFGLSGSRG
ncbi:hypothetical protein B14911_02724 [Bacillus sp. NRRL B-14911]|uniref:Uncharacterized protein n=1 Tax=Bacillus infantis NRRL B-14911 TaxID=1367477 RepID=U5LGP0_9BACI|nr:hypothetical protein N288_23805 [Bacillus infantis NRRL B-14911]EAR68461.1 hypothetical protein B14911_02724 [Bacillus sp. NRRL B-14911]